MAYNRRFGPWRSLASALAWGARGPEFKSRRPDQIPQRVTDTHPPWTSGLESNRSPNVDASARLPRTRKTPAPILGTSHPRKICLSRFSVQQTDSVSKTNVGFLQTFPILACKCRVFSHALSATAANRRLSGPGRLKRRLRPDHGDSMPAPFGYRVRVNLLPGFRPLIATV